MESIVNQDGRGAILNIVKFIFAIILIAGSYFVFKYIIFGHSLSSSINSEYKLLVAFVLVAALISLWYVIYGRRKRK